MKIQDYDHTRLMGIDASLEISLKEYGLAWIETEKEILFYYGIRNIGNEYDRFDFCAMEKNLDFIDEFCWIDFDNVLDYVGMNKEYWLEMPLPARIHDLLSYYGYENVFGSSYNNGLTYSQVIKGNQS